MHRRTRRRDRRSPSRAQRGIQQMTLVLYRIDDRLIHGQVVVGWGQPLNVAFIVLVNDEVAASEWEQELYRMGVPPGMEVHFDTVARAIREIGRASCRERV